MKNIFLFIFLFQMVMPVMGQKRQVVYGHVHEMTKNLKSLGRLDGNTNMDIIIGLPLRNQSRLEEKLKELYDPASENYRHFMTPAQFTEQFGPNKPDYDALLAFARSNKFKIINAPPNRALLHIQAPAQMIEKVFQVELLRYENPKTHKPFYAPDREPSIDLELRILHISGLDNIAKSFPHGASKVEVGSGAGGSYMGNDFRTAYAPDVPLTGTGQVIGLVSFSDYAAADITAYETAAGLPNVIIRKVYLSGLKEFIVAPPQIINDFDPELEISLDIEMAISMAPGASITVYGVPDHGSTADVLNEIANPTKGEPFPNQISCSVAVNYGGSDPTILNAFFQMAMQGQSFFASSGDEGAYADNASVPGPLPYPPGDYNYVTSVGGTILTMNGNGASYTSEMAWGRSGGGPSPWFKIKPWQLGPVSSTNSGNKSMRNCPDVSMAAANIFVVSNGGVVSTNIGGTSASSPLWAGFMALVNQQAAIYGKPPVGFVNPAIYLIGSSPSYKNCFHDIITGNNSSTGNPDKYRATAGYDLATGWGSPTGINLINALALRIPDIINAKLEYQSRSMSGCDAGPVAGGTAVYHVKVYSGTGPYIYQWSATGTTIISGGNINSSTVVVNIPPLGLEGVLNVTITDANGSHMTATKKISGLDPSLLRRLEQYCLISNEVIYHYISPNLPFEGDPVPFLRTQLKAFTKAELRNLSEKLTRMQTIVKSMQHQQ